MAINMVADARPDAFSKTLTAISTMVPASIYTDSALKVSHGIKLIEIVSHPKLIW
jgi:hypothetical protein